MWHRSYKGFNDITGRYWIDVNESLEKYEDEYKSLYYESGNSIFMMTADNISVKDMYEMIRQMERVEK